MTFLNSEIQIKTREKYKLNLEILKPNQTTFGRRSLRSYGPKIWNALPYHIKTSDNLVSNPLSNVGTETIALAESANIRLQDNRLSQNIILKYLSLYEIQCETKTL